MAPRLGSHRKGFRWRRLYIALVAVPAIPIIFLFGGYFWIHGSLESYENILTVPGIERPVEIVRDKFAIPHIYAHSERDAAFAMGFVHAQDRLWQMELQRRIGAGRLSEIFGERGLATDRFLRTLGIYDISEQNLKHLSGSAQDLYESYSAGVNTYLQNRSGPLPPEFLILGHSPEAWQPADSVVWLKMMAWDLSANFRSELLRARLNDRLSAIQLADLWPLHTDNITPPATTRPLAGMQPFDIDFEALATALPQAKPSGLGSNNWVVSGAHTETGKPLLANDPHLDLSIPSVWYLAHINTPTFDVIGATLPGLPLPLLGRTQHFAWGFTNTGADVQDLFIEEIDPKDPSRYLTPDGSKPFLTRDETILVAGADPLQITVRGTRHGPVISDLVPDSKKAITPNQVLALAWTALEPDDVTAQSLVLAAKATDWNGFVEAVKNLHVPQQNIVFADRSGNIGYIAPGRVPIRAQGNGRFPSPGWTGQYDWIGWIPFAELPHNYNPPSGQILTANNKVVRDDYPFFLTDDWSPPYRAARIGALLEATTHHTSESLAAIQQDTLSLGAKRLLPVLLKMSAHPDQITRDAIDMLTAWNHNVDPHRAEPLIYFAWLRSLMKVLFADELGSVFRDYWDIRVEVVYRVLSERTSWCDNVGTFQVENCTEAVTSALSDALKELIDRYGADINSWTWGDAHFAWMRHRLLSEIPVIGEWFDVRLPSGGEKDTVNAGGFKINDPDQPFTQTHGATYRAIYDLGEPQNSIFVQSTGQSGNPLSPYYSNFSELWLEGQYLPMLTERIQIESNSIGTITLNPQ